MRLRDLGHLSWGSPLLDDGVRVDPFVGARLDGGELRLELASGATVEARCTIPCEGVLRLRLGDALPQPESPILVALPHELPAELAEVDGAIAVTGAGVSARIATSGTSFELEPFRRAQEPAAMPLPLVPLGRLVAGDDASPRGWIEAAALGPTEAIYGGGESVQGPNLRGRIRRVVNCETHGTVGVDASYLNVPFFWSDRGWGIFVHTGGPVRADLGATHDGLAAFAVEGPSLDVFLLTGDPRTLLARYLSLTGLPGPFPAWGLGVWMSRCSYLSEREVSDVVHELRAADCPVDVVHVDAWMEGDVLEELTCNWSVDRRRFPEGWVQRLADQGVRVSLWHNPYLLEGSPRAAEAEAAGVLLAARGGGFARTPDKPDRVIVDFTAPAGVAWWRDRVRETLEREGHHTYKPDFGEMIPADAVFADGRTGMQVRNEYGLRYQAATHAELVEQRGDAALFCRSGTAGSQRYPCHWVGDTPSTWSGLTSALRTCLSLSLSGFAFVGHDIGGFWVDGSLPPLQEAFRRFDGSELIADVDPELFARWAQWGALSPVMRFHGTARREPTAYPEPWRGVAIEACRLRHRLLRYLERSSVEATATGLPLMRPMALAYPGDPVGRDAALQYLLGPDVLVAPLLEAGGEQTVWAPPGRWTPLCGLEAIEGPAFATVRCAPSQFPAWIRAGAEADVVDG